VASFAVKNSLVAVLVGRVESLVAHAALEAFLVELQLPNGSGLSGVHRFGASGALDLGGGLEGHFGCLGSRKLTGRFKVPCGGPAS